MKKKYLNVAFYKFVHFPNYTSFQSKILNFCVERNIKGTILLAEEGINAAAAGTKKNIYELLNFLKTDNRFSDITHKESYSEEIPFHRMRVKLKKEIVSLGRPNINLSNRSGIRVDPKNWNILLADPDVVLVDARNDYEYQIGTFKNAISPKTANFREFPAFIKEKLNTKKNKKIAIFCTGGIRCEKASSYMLSKGFENVYQLNGGILKYMDEIETDKSLWEGECFVFDSRVSVDSELAEGNYEQCYACRRPLSEKELQSNLYQKGISCPYCINETSDAQRASFRERQQQVELAKKRNEKHIGVRIN
ncbi:uncharacterized protein METZ01_LOCUS113790 [marine metagenome]|uniref:Rhodanese domain-containing protein n=1 Tax=marine metagenome TaxID=408172 RepID=A0A381X837_9ZZZZ